MREAHLRIFPCQKEEFPSLDLLTMWLATGLKARAGNYHLRSRTSVADLVTGSIVFFRYGQSLVGEAIVSAYETFQEPKRDRTLMGQEADYEASVTFCASSIRLYVPPVEVSALEQITGRDLSVARTYHRFEDWSIYARLLSAHVANGGAF